MQREKGKRGEREVVALARAYGHAAVRTWQTAQGANSECDITINDAPYQVKLRKDFKFLYDAIDGVDGVFLRGDNKHWLVVLDAKSFLIALKETCGKT